MKIAIWRFGNWHTNSTKIAVDLRGRRYETGSRLRLWFDKEGKLPPEIVQQVKTFFEGDRMQTGHELFLHGLNDMMDAEHQLVEALEELAGDSSRADLKKAFQQHRSETEGQIERLEQCFELLGEESEQTECHGIRGLIAEKKAFSEEDPSEDLIDVFNVGAAIKAESYEICEYESLIDMAREMKHTKVAQLLSQNLKEEKATLKKMETFSERVKPNEMMNEEQEAKAAANEKPSRKKRAA
jgi:ferritin-like metal-binding protein YciE